MGLTGADTGLEGRGWGPLEKSPLDGLPELKGLSTYRETDTRCGHSRALASLNRISVIHSHQAAGEVALRCSTERPRHGQKMSA